MACVKPPKPPSLVTQPAARSAVQTLQDSKKERAQSEQVRLKILWDKQMGIATKPVRYAKSSVLTLSWQPEDDDLGVEKEVKDLSDVFRNKYGFNVHSKSLNTNQNAELQAFKHLLDFVCAEDAEHGLLIVYYAGHGYSEVEECGNIRLSGKQLYGCVDDEAKSIDWSYVENAIAKTKSDVFVIFDCCNAGLLCRPARRGRRRRCFQYLGACTEGSQTRRAGPDSFTSAMIWALEQLADRKCFPVTELQSMITEAPKFPKEQSPVFYGARYETSLELIFIAPMLPRDEDAETPIGDFRSEQEAGEEEFLDIRLHVDRKLAEQDIVQICEALKTLKRTTLLDYRHVALLGKHSHHAYKHWAWDMWRHGVSQMQARKRRETLITETPVVHSNGSLEPPTIGLITGSPVSEEPWSGMTTPRVGERAEADEETPLLSRKTVGRSSPGEEPANGNVIQSVFGAVQALLRAQGQCLGRRKN